MARKLRQFNIGNVYHVVNRGVEGRPIFIDDRDHLRFIQSLYLFNDENIVVSTYRKLTGGMFPRTGSDPVLVNKREGERIPITELLGFALMPNHFHLILREIKEGGISEFMKRIGGGYASYFNYMYNRVGGLFQSRFKDVEVKTDEQLMNVFVYVHTNPVELVEKGWKDGRVKSFEKATSFLESYRWSSYLDYARRENFPDVSSRDFYSSIYGGSQECRKEVYGWIKYKAANFEPGKEIIE